MADIVFLDGSKHVGAHAAEALARESQRRSMGRSVLHFALGYDAAARPELLSFTRRKSSLLRAFSTRLA